MRCWAKGNGGTYCYYRCAGKGRTFGEKYLRDHLLVEQCIDTLKPIAITEDESSAIRKAINETVQKDDEAITKNVEGIKKELISVQYKLDNLTDKYLDEVIDEDSYKSASARLVAKKAELKEQKRRFLKKQSAYWIEPAYDYVNTLESISKWGSATPHEEIAGTVQKLGLNHKISDKKNDFRLAKTFGLYRIVPSSKAERVDR